MITQEDIYFFFENIASQFRIENIPILNNIIYDFKNYPSIDDLDTNQEYSDNEISDYDEIDNSESS